MSGRVIAVDGPAASGKSTVSRRVAQSLGWLYVDSGALYRGVTWKALHEGVPTDSPEALSGMVRKIGITFHVSGGAVCFLIDGRSLGLELRSDTINAHVSPVAVVPDVRAQVVRWLRDMLALGDLVVEGRDIGTAVFPETPFKFYLDASPEERARRRHSEVAARDARVSVAGVEDSLLRRDRIDSSRKVDPLRVAEGAVVIDSTTMGVDAVVARILDAVQLAD